MRKLSATVVGLEIAVHGAEQRREHGDPDKARDEVARIGGRRHARPS